MPRLRRTPLNLHKLVKLQYPSLAARPAFTTLVKDRLTRMMYAFLCLSALVRVISSIAASPSTRHALANRECGVVRFRFGRRSWGLRGLWLCRRRIWNPRCSRLRSNFLSSGSRVRLWRGGSVVDGAVLAGRAGRYGEKFVESEDTGLATFPTCKGCQKWIQLQFFWRLTGNVCTNLFGLRGRLEGRDGIRMARPRL
jgi:hypothetical protein